MKTIKELSHELSALAFNPNLLQAAVINSLSDVVNEESMEIVDPSNPFIFMIDSAVALASASIEHSESCLRKQYPAMSTMLSDLYPHMSDKDHLDLFSQPTEAVWTVLLSLDELKAKAVPVDGIGVRKLIIPRDTKFMINGYVFTMQYAVEIRNMPHGGIQVVYDTTNMSPVRMLTTNNLDWKIVKIPYGAIELDMIVINIPVMQYAIATYSESIVAGNIFKHDYTFTDQFFTARVWLKDRADKWVEINTTYSQEVINPDRPTAQLMVKEHSLSVSIPDIYIRTGLAKGDIRIDIYTTKGKLDLDLQQFSADSFTMKTADIGGEINSGYYTPLSTFSNFTSFSTSVVTGGRNSLTFQEVKNRRIDNASSGRIPPVSPPQLESTLKDKGFKLTKSIDYVTERIYLASTEMPASTMESVSTPVGNINGIINTSRNELAGLSTVHDNGSRMTITPKTLYREENGVVVIESRSIDELKRLPISTLVGAVNENNYLYSPLHYVIDNNSDIVTMRAYYLDNAHVVGKQFVETNSTLMLEVNTNAIVLETTDYGYRLLVTTKSGDTYKALADRNVHAQISFTPRGYADTYTYCDGVLLEKGKDGERTFEFRIETTLDIDLNHDLVINNFIVAGNNATPSPIQLDCEMNIIFAVSNYTTPDFKHSNIDKVLTSNVRDCKGVTHEIINIEFGKPLEKIWSNIRGVVDGNNYKRYPEDVYATYTKDVYKTNADGAPIYTIATVDGKPKVVFEYKHRKGDKVLTDGKPTILHKAGSVVIENGKPVIANSRRVAWRLELFLFDAMYAFANTNESKNYMAKVISSLLKWLTVDIPAVSGPLLEKTQLYMYPRTTMGLIDVRLADGSTTSIDPRCKFELFYYLTSAGRRNEDLLKTINRISRQVILSNLENKTISVSAVVKDIRDKLGSEIVDVEMESIGGSGERLYTVLNESEKMTLGKKVVENPDGTIGIKDDIAIVYTRHDN